jgi:hypothetical protein
MALEEGQVGNKSSGKLAVMVVGVILALFLAIYMLSTAVSKQSVECKVPNDIKISYDKPLANDQRLDKSYWACNGMVCNRFMTPQEWVNKNCYNQNGQNLCVVKTPQGNLVYPLNALNLTAIRDCAEYLCLQEVIVRNASYIIPAP